MLFIKRVTFKLLQIIKRCRRGSVKGSHINTACRFMRDIAPDNFAFCWRGLLDGDYVAVNCNYLVHLLLSLLLEELGSRSSGVRAS